MCVAVREGNYRSFPSPATKLKPSDDTQTPNPTICCDAIPPSSAVQCCSTIGPSAAPRQWATTFETMRRYAAAQSHHCGEYLPSIMPFVLFPFCTLRLVPISIVVSPSSLNYIIYNSTSYASCVLKFRPGNCVNLSLSHSVLYKPW